MVVGEGDGESFGVELEEVLTETLLAGLGFHVLAFLEHRAE